MAKFKRGDRVLRTMGSDLTIGAEYEVLDVSKDGKWLALVGENNNSTSNGFPFFAEYFIPISSENVEEQKLPVHFILQYEFDQDPFETFSTMKEVEARIKELAKRSDLKKDSIKAYEVSKTYDIKLETRVLFSPKVTLKVAPKKKATKKK